MSNYLWDELSPSEQETARSLFAQIDEQFHGFAVPAAIGERLAAEPALHPEVAEVREILGYRSWETVDRQSVLDALHTGVAVIHLCDQELFSYFVPLFMSLSLKEVFSDEVDDMHVESIVRRMRTRTLDWTVYSDQQKAVVADFLALFVFEDE